MIINSEMPRFNVFVAVWKKEKNRVTEFEKS